MEIVPPTTADSDGDDNTGEPANKTVHKDPRSVAFRKNIGVREESGSTEKDVVESIWGGACGKGVQFRVEKTERKKKENCSARKEPQVVEDGLDLHTLSQVILRARNSA